MNNLWNTKKAQQYKSDLDLSVYISNLLGQNDKLSLHGSGKTSVKTEVNGENTLLIAKDGIALQNLHEEDFVLLQRKLLLEIAKSTKSNVDELLLDKNLLVNAVLHALIPYKFVEQIQADAIVTISNSVDGKKHLAKLFPNFLIVDYKTPNFAFVEEMYAMTQEMDWDSIDGIIVEHHSIFCFDDDAKTSYTKMIEAVTIAESFLDEHALIHIEHNYVHSDCDISRIVQTMSKYKEDEVCIAINQTPLAAFYASQENLREFASRGVLMPEQIKVTKRVPLIMEDTDLINGLESYIRAYQEYFVKYAKDERAKNPAPNYMIIKNLAVISFGKTREEAKMVYEILQHTMLAVLRADKLGGYKSIGEKESFEMEYMK